MISRPSTVEIRSETADAGVVEHIHDRHVTHRPMVYIDRKLSREEAGAGQREEVRLVNCVLGGMGAVDIIMVRYLR